VENTTRGKIADNIVVEELFESQTSEPVAAFNEWETKTAKGRIAVPVAPLAQDE
jgi:hypothetical protein